MSGPPYDPPVERLPYVDEHAIEVGAPRATTWTALDEVVARMLRTAERSPVGALLGTDPRAGFAITQRAAPERLVLHGRHRFSRYALTFDLEDSDGGTRVRATTRAAFPGARGRIYRVLVIGTHLHVLATRRILRDVRERAQAPA